MFLVKMKMLLGLFLCFYIIQINCVESMKLFNTIEDSVSKTGQNVKCGLHQFGNIFKSHKHENDPCQAQNVNKGDHDHDEENSENSQQPNRGDDQSHHGHDEENSENTQPSIDVRGEDTSSTESSDHASGTTEEGNSENTQPSIDVRGKDTSSTESSDHASAATEEGRRLLGVKKNCPTGTHDDGFGNCREEY